jgi:hypothetical protein
VTRLAQALAELGWTESRNLHTVQCREGFDEAEVVAALRCCPTHRPAATLCAVDWWASIEDMSFAEFPSNW